MSSLRQTLTVVGRRLVPEHHRLRDFLTRIAQPFEWVEAGTEEAGRVLGERGLAEAELPVVIDREESVTGATVERLVEAWHLTDPPSRTAYDLAVVGAGPAGLAAAVYSASDGLSTLVVERDVPGGQASHTSLIENFFGFPDGIGGAELARLAGRQAEGFGAELLLLRAVEGHRRYDDGRITFELSDGSSVSSDVALAAPGMEWRKLDVDGVEGLLGSGVYYGAWRSEAAQCGGDDVVVIGAGNSAGQAVLNLANAGARVRMLVRGERLGRTMSAYLVTRIEAHPLIDVRLGTQAEGLREDGGRLTGVTVAGSSGTTGELPARALFICIGGAPRTAWAEDSGVRTDRAGFILTGPDLLDRGSRPAGWPLERDPLALETSLPGLFAAGDVRSGSTKRVAAAVGEGSMAVALAHRRLEEMAAG